MSSMLRQHHVKIQDLVNYLRGYDPAKPQTAEDWSKQESSGFEPGMLIFCLERVSAPSGLAFGKKESEGETYRVKDLCVVVGRDNNRSLVVNITASAFELRYLEVLMLEKARKAILDGKDFLYVAVKPAQPLGDAKLREIEELGAMYAQGGSRRSLVVDASGPQEPAVALLAALGVKLSIGGIGKQVLDIGAICHMLFAPEGRQEDKNKTIVKSCFAAIPNNEPIGKGGQTSAFTPAQQAPSSPPVRIRPAPPPPQPPQEWGPGPSSSGWATDLQTPEPAPQAPSFGYDQSSAQQPAQQGFGYEQTPPAGFGYEQPLPSGDWHQTSGPTGGFGLSGLDPFAAPTETGPDVGQFEHTDLTPPDFTNQFKDDNQFPPPPDLAFSQPTPAAQQYGADQFPPSTVFNDQQFNNEHFQSPDFSHAQELGADSSTTFNAPPQQPFSSFPPLPGADASGEDMFKPPYEGAQTKTGEHPSLPHDLTSKLDPQNLLFQAPETETAAPVTAQTDVPEVNFGFDAFNQQPPSEFVDSVFDTTSGAFEKTSRAMSFDEQNESALEEPGAISPASTPSTALPPISASSSSTNLPTMATAESSTDLPSMSPGASNTNLSPMAPSASSTNLPAASSEPASFAEPPTGSSSRSHLPALPTNPSSTNLPALSPSPALTNLPLIPPSGSTPNLPAQDNSGWAQVPTEDWATPTQPASDWGVESKPTAKSDSLPWSPEPGSADWAPEPTPTTPAADSAPTWNFEGASQAPAWMPEQEPATASNVSWTPVVEPEKTEEPVTAAEPENESETQSSAPSLFERLNQQLQKGSLSEIEPPPVVSEMTGAPQSEFAPTVEKLGETTLNIKTGEPAEPRPDQAAIPALGADGLPTSEYAKTPLPPPVTPEEPVSVPDPLPLGVSKKNAPLILDWPSAPSDFGGPADTADNLPAARPPRTRISTGSETAPGSSEAAAASAQSTTGPDTVSGASEAAPAESTVPSFAPTEQAEAPATRPTDSAIKGTDSSSSIASLPSAQQASATGAGDGIKHLAEALSGLMGDENEARPLSPFANIKPPPAEKAPQPAPADAPAQAEPVMSSESAATVDTTEHVAPPAVSTEVPVAEVEQPPAQPEAAPEEEFEEEEEMSPSAVLAAKGFHEPRLVMNEMASLMSKLEQQVQKAAKKLNARAEDIKQRLLTQVDSLVADATQIEKESQRSTTNLSQRLIKQLDDTCEESRLKASDVAANGRYTIKQLLTANQNHVDETKTTLYESLREACKQFRIETEALARTAETDLNELVTKRTEELTKVVAAMNAHLDDTHGSYNDKLNARFERFKERMSEEASSVVRSLERNVRSMVEEIDGSWDRASDKLKSSKSDFEQTIQHSVKTAELNLSQSTRLILTNALIPKLRERQNVLRMTSVELSKRFSEESESQVTGQIMGLEASLGAARQQLQRLVDDCMSSIDSVGRGQQAGLEEIFKEASAHAERATAEVSEFLSKIETQIHENEQTCKRLAETSSVDSDPELSSDRNEATQRVQHLRQQANTELSTAIDQSCARLEHLSNNVHTEVAAIRVEHTQAVRDAAENGITRVRDAIQEAFSAIQAAREKYME